MIGFPHSDIKGIGKQEMAQFIVAVLNGKPFYFSMDIGDDKAKKFSEVVDIATVA